MSYSSRFNNTIPCDGGYSAIMLPCEHAPYGMALSTEGKSMGTGRKSFALTCAVLSFGLVASACSSSTTPSSTKSSTTAAAVPQINAADFTADFALMKQLTGLASQGKGMIGVLLPDTTTSTRYVQYDAPYLKQAFEAAGLSAANFKIDNANGSASTMQTQAEADINAGASVLLVDPLDPGSGAAIEAKAVAAGVKVIDYDRLVTGGPADRYYVSFDNANAVISVLKKNNIPAKKFPTTGQDASLPGLQNILTGYQCGTVYKPIYLEAQAAAALALYLRAGQTPPGTLANATTADAVLKTDIKSVYTTPVWVTTENMAATVVKDGAVKVAELCAGATASGCAAAGIK